MDNNHPLTQDLLAVRVDHAKAGQNKEGGENK